MIKTNATREAVRSALILFFVSLCIGCAGGPSLRDILKGVAGILSGGADMLPKGSSSPGNSGEDAGPGVCTSSPEERPEDASVTH